MFPFTLVIHIDQIVSQRKRNTIFIFFLSTKELFLFLLLCLKAFDIKRKYLSVIVSHYSEKRFYGRKKRNKENNHLIYVKENSLSY
jgi:hypothetical protein